MMPEITVWGIAEMIVTFFLFYYYYEEDFSEVKSFWVGFFFLLSLLK